MAARMAQRKAHRRAHPGAVGAVSNRHGATMQFDRLPNETQAKAGAFAAGLRTFQRVETIEEPRQCIFSNAVAFVLDLDFRPWRVIGTSDVDLDAVSGHSEVEGVLQKIGQRDFKQEGFADYAG